MILFTRCESYFLTITVNLQKRWMGICIRRRVVTFLSHLLYIAFLICGPQEEELIPRNQLRGIQINKETNISLENIGEVNLS